MGVQRQYTASAYTIDFKNHRVLLVHNVKLNKWGQPGGHILDDELEYPSDAAIRETKEETGIDIKIIGPKLGNEVQPVALRHYINQVGDMIDIQYVAEPLNIELSSPDAIWQDIFLIDVNPCIDDKLKEDVKSLYRPYTK